MKEKQEIVYKNVKDLIPYVNNTRTHDDKQIKQIAASIKEFGWTNPILTGEDNDIIAGHGRVLAAEKLGINEVPVIVLKGLTEAQKKACIIADNKLALNAGWDDELLAIEIDGLKELDFDLSLIGFNQDELDRILMTDEDFGEDFSLPDTDRNEIQQKTFTLHEKQIELIEYAMQSVDNGNIETFGNTNKSGNLLYMVVKEWAEQRK